MKKLVLGILAHVDAGKTTLSEALLYTCGSIRKLGRVDHRNTALDTHKIELCLLDTPGHADLTAETERTLDVIDYALLVISGTDGVQAHTETLWRLLERHNVPTIIFATKMDLTGSDRQRILSDLREQLFEKFASGQDIADGDISRLILERKLFPVLYGSGLKLEGVQELVEFIEKYAVSPEYPEQFGARVYKIMRDARDRRLSCMKITGGALHNRAYIPAQITKPCRRRAPAASSPCRGLTIHMPVRVSALRATACSRRPKRSCPTASVCPRVRTRLLPTGSSSSSRTRILS